MADSVGANTAVDSATAVAVETKQAVSVSRKTMLSQPSVKIACRNGATMSSPVVIDVIDGEECRFLFPTALTLTTVGGDDLLLQAAK